MSSARKVSGHEVAALAGVSQATVSRVINNHPGISPATVKAVKKSIEALGYDPGHVNTRMGPRSRRHRPSTYRRQQVALLYHRKPSLLHAPVFARLMAGIEDELRRIAYNLILRTLPVGEVFRDAWIPRKIDGAILFYAREEENSGLLRHVRRMPCVNVLGVPGENELFDRITCDNERIGTLAGEHLMSKGHTRLVVMEPGSNPFDTVRSQAFMAAAKHAGAESVDCVHDDFLDESRDVQLPNLDAFHRAITKMKQLPQLPTAIFAESDMIAVGLYRTLGDHGIAPGEDVEIVGVNNDCSLIDHLTPRPASIDNRTAEIGRKAVEQLLWRIDHPKEPLATILVEPEMMFE